jgi:hypothetical protein
MHAMNKKKPNAIPRIAGRVREIVMLVPLKISDEVVDGIWVRLRTACDFVVVAITTIVLTTAATAIFVRPALVLDVYFSQTNGTTEVLLDGIEQFTERTPIQCVT